MRDLWFTLTHIDGDEINILASDIAAFGPRSQKGQPTENIPPATKILTKGGCTIVVKQLTGVIKDAMLKIYMEDPPAGGCRPGFYKP